MMKILKSMSCEVLKEQTKYNNNRIIIIICNKNALA